MSAAHRPLTLWLVATLASINVHLATDSEQRPVIVVVLHNYAAIAPAILEHAARAGDRTFAQLGIGVRWMAPPVSVENATDGLDELVAATRCGTLGRRLLELAQQPGLCKLPVTHHGVNGHVQCFGGLLHRKTAEEPHLHDLRFPGVERRKRVERIVEGDEVLAGLGRDDERFVERHFLRTASAFLIALGSREVDENPPHQPRGHREEMRAILPLHLPYVDEPDKGFVDQRRGLQGVADAFVRHVAACEAAQLVMDER